MHSLVLFTLHNVLLANIYLHQLNRNVFISGLVLAHPDLYVVSGGLWQLLVEPGRVSAAGTTTPISQRLTLETILSSRVHFVARITEIVVAHKRWRV